MMRKIMFQNIPLKNHILTLMAFVIILFLLPFIFGTNGLSLISEILIWSLAATSLNLLLGDSGLVSFGHSGFFAVGAYTFGLLSYFNVVSFPIAIIFAIFAIALYAIISGYFIIKLVEIYFALLCLAFSQIIFVWVSVWYNVTGGDDGLNGIPIPSILQSSTNTYYFISVCFVICMTLLYLFRSSCFGASLRAIRDNRVKAAFIGINIQKYIFVAFLISGIFCGLAGILLAIHLRCVFPGYASFVRSGDFLFICLLGGIYHFSGPFIGAIFFVLLNYFVSKYIEYWPLVMGISLIFIALFFRGGIVGVLIKVFKKYFLKRDWQ